MDNDGFWQTDHSYANVELNMSELRQATLEALEPLISMVLMTLSVAYELRIVSPVDDQGHQTLRLFGFYECVSLAVPPTCDFRIDDYRLENPGPTNEGVVPLAWVQEESDLQHAFFPALERRVREFDTNPLAQFEIATLLKLVRTAIRALNLTSSGAPAAMVLIAARMKSIEDGGHRITIVLGLPRLMHGGSSSAIARLFNRQYPPINRDATDWYDFDRTAKSLGGCYCFRSGHTSLERDYRYFPASELLDDDALALAGNHLHIRIDLGVGRPHDVDNKAAATTINYQHFALNTAFPEQIARAIFSGLAWTPTQDVVLVDVGAVAVDVDKAAGIVRAIVKWSHPHRTAIIGIRLTEAQIAAVCEIVNGYYESAIIDGDHYQPVLVIGATFRSVYWVGSTPEIIAALEAKTSVRANDYYRLASYELGGDDSGLYRITLNASNIHAATSADYLANILQNTTAKNNVVYVPPALESVQAWIDLRQVFRSFPGGPTALACLLATKLYDLDPALISYRPSLICEENITDEFAKVLASSLKGGLAGPDVYQRVRPRDIEASRRLSLDHSRPVIVVVGVLGSGQTVRHLIALALRQNYRVLGVAALADSRAEMNASIDVWETTFRVAALGAGFPLDAERSSYPAEVRYLDRAGRAEIAIDDRPKWPVSTSDAIELLGAADSISLGHFTSSHDRHFTFYVDAMKALVDQEARRAFVRAAALKLIEWARQRDAGPIIVRHPSLAFGPDDAAQLFAQLIVQEARSEIGRPINVMDTDEDIDLNDADVVHVDWGSVTGDSIIRSLNGYRRKKVAKLLYITLFSQVSEHLESHLESLEAMATGPNNSVVVDLWFAARLPIVAYPQYRCPVCSQMATHAEWIQKYFAEGLAGERERISVRTWLSMQSTSFDPIAIAYGAEGEPDASAKALLRRSDLVDAQQSVRSAFNVKSRIIGGIGDPGWFLSLLTLVLYEPQWLRTPPLSAQDVRMAFAEECLNSILSPSLELSNAFRAKAIIGLRLASKVVFARNFAKIFDRLRGEPALESLSLYMCATILSRDYLANTGLPIVLAEQLASAEEQAIARRTLCGTDVPRGLESALDRATALRGRGESLDVPRWETLYKLQKKVAEFQYHRVYESYRRADPRLYTEGAKFIFLSEWKVLSRWILAEIAPRVDVLESYLKLTHSLSNSIAFAKLFDRDGNRFRELMESCAQLPSPPLPELSEAYKEIGELFDPAAESPELLDACSECSTPLGNFIQEFEDECAKQGVNFLAELTIDALPRVLLPSRFRVLLVQNIVGNAVKHQALTGSPPTIEFLFQGGLKVGLDREATLRIDTYGGRETRRGSSRVGPGGLSEINEIAPRGVKVSRQVRTIEGRGLRFGVHVQVPTWAGV